MTRHSPPRRFARFMLAWALLAVLVWSVGAAIQLGPLTLLTPQAMKLEGANAYIAASNRRNGEAVPPSPQFERAGSPSAQPRMNINDAVQSLRFLQGVGGVAFGSEAKGVDGRSLVSIAYDTNRTDGERLSLTIRTREGRDTVVTGHFADWLLVPAARLAAQENISCVTLFGKLRDPAADAACHAAGQTIVNYNPALEGCLLGLRLMQADLLLLSPDLAVELPRTETGILLGPGEAQPNLDSNHRRADEMRQFIDGLPGGLFQSYLICDLEVEITFTAQNGALELSGWPYWFCWRHKTQDPAAFADVQRQANLQAQQQLDREESAGTAGDPAGRKNRFSALFDQYASRALLAPMPEYSKAVSAKMKYTEGGNPAVYQALTSAMRLTAVFRRAQRECPEQWRRFLEALPVRGLYSPEWAVTVIPMPDITTRQSTASPGTGR